MSIEESQGDELLALENIYTLEEFKPTKENGQLGGQFYANIAFENDLKLMFKDLRDPESCFQELSLNYLPPLSLRFTFPKDYPSSSPPNFTLSCQWLRRKEITKLCRKLDTIWDENKGMEIIYIWTQFLKEEAVKFLGIDKELDISKIYTHHLNYVDQWQKRRKGFSKRRGRSRKGSASQGEVASSCRSPTSKEAVEKFEEDGSFSKETQNSSEHSILLGYRIPKEGSDKCSIEESSVCEKGALPIQVEVAENEMACCRNLKLVDNNSVDTDENCFAEDQMSTKEPESNSKDSLETEPEGVENKQYLQHQESKGLPAGLVASTVSEASSSVKYSVLRTEANDSVNKYSGDSDASADQSENQSAQNVGDTICNIPRVEGTDVKSEPVCVHPSIHSTRGKKSFTRRRTCMRKKIDGDLLASSRTDQDKEAGQLPVRHNNRHDLDKRAVVDLNSRISVIHHLLEYNSRRKKLQFERSWHTCKICFEDKLGVYCMAFEPCWHAFCSDCISSYFEVRIKEGTVLSIPCPEDKCPSEAQQSHVRALVNSEMFAKYDSILLSSVLDTQPNLVYCPRQQCQYPVFQEDRNDKLATCPECNYSFCVLCRKVYHGVANCAILPKEKRELMKVYFEASEEEKEKMHVKYGKQQMKNLVDTFHLEWCEAWIQKKSKKCPHCGVFIEKASGCNKMLCWKCDTFFCWLCNKRLDKLKPYDHFNDPKSQCYNTLLEGIMVGDFDGELGAEN